MSKRLLWEVTGTFFLLHGIIRSVMGQRRFCIVLHAPMVVKAKTVVNMAVVIINVMD